MNVLLLYAHPVESSFNAALHRLILERLQARGHTVDDCNLYAEGFDPVMSRGERLLYHSTGANAQAVQPYVDRLRRADALVLCFPVWNYGFPAILKGFFDRIFVPGVSFDLAEGKISYKLRNIRKLCAVTSYGGSRWRAVLMGDPPRKLVLRWLRVNFGVFVPADYLAHYGMNVSTEASRKSFMAKVAARMDAL